MTTLKELGEHNAIAALTANLKAVGDDCAVLPADSQYDMVLTTDPLICGVHFTPDTPPEQIGWKAAARVISDIAAMGGEPQYLLVNLVAPGDLDFAVLQAVYRGMESLRNRFGVDLVGGDLAQGPVLELHVFGVGRVPRGTALLRSGAHAGDVIYVTGPLGGSFASGKHLTFMPRVREGKWLRQSGFVRSMMDISDGLATDLRHIMKASGTGADLDGPAVPSAGTLEQALFDGEDFELLFTVRAEEADEFDFVCLETLEQKFIRIGRMTDRSDVLRVDGVELTRKAYEHFKG